MASMSSLIMSRRSTSCSRFRQYDAGDEALARTGVGMRSQSQEFIFGMNSEFFAEVFYVKAYHIGRNMVNIRDDIGVLVLYELPEYLLFTLGQLFRYRQLRGKSCDSVHVSEVLCFSTYFNSELP